MKIKAIVGAFAIASLAALLASVGLERGWWRMNHPSRARFPLWGVDVSHHQSRVDWAALAASEQQIAFAYLKATEGGDWRDSRFTENWREARRAGLKVGAYHFFTFCRPADEQARHFLAVSPREPDALPPAVDLEFGGNCRQRPANDAVRRELKVWLETVERAVGKRPIIYVTPDAYRTFLAQDDLGYPIWIRNVWSEPSLGPRPPWVFWQFANRARVGGVGTFVDLNVFNGTREELNRL